VSHFSSGEDLQRELVAFLTEFLGSDDGARAIQAARALGDSATLVVHTVDPDAVVSVDFFSASVSLDAREDADVAIELEADALHDILMNRLDPVQLSRLYETDRLAFSGASEHLGALVMLAGAIQPHYPDSLARRGREDLLNTPMPPTKVAWGSPEEALSPKRVIGRRRPWQRPKKTAEAV
jgi:hypothetical protein